jgi:tRNA U34 2-thiouridine synthase MnmA/TrmU
MESNFLVLITDEVNNIHELKTFKDESAANKYIDYLANKETMYKLRFFIREFTETQVRNIFKEIKSDFFPINLSDLN